MEYMKSQIKIQHVKNSKCVILSYQIFIVSHTEKTPFVKKKISHKHISLAELNLTFDISNV